jgi:hypothetical protein
MTFYDLLDDEEDEDDDGSDEEDAAADDGIGNDGGDDDDGDDGDDGDDDARIGGAHGMSLDASDVRPPRCAALLVCAFLAAEAASCRGSLCVIFTPRLTRCAALALDLATLLSTIPA